MGLRVEALYTLTADAKLEGIRDIGGGVAPRFYLGRTRAGHVWRFRADVPNALVAELTRLCRAEPVSDTLPTQPVHCASYRALLAEHAPIQREWSGPCYRFDVAPATAEVGCTEPGSRSGFAPLARREGEEIAVPILSLSNDASGVKTERGRLSATDLRCKLGGTVELGPANAELLAADWDPWLARAKLCVPFVAALTGEGEHKRVVSVCASVRLTAAVHEAGVETMPAFRQRGHALRAVAHWVELVQRAGAAALYSTAWDNHASQAIAVKLGAASLGADFHLT
jgi:hypothetical protein